MERFGDYLKAQREKKSIRLEEIASITKIHLHSLELLEANQWEQLPPEPFIRGFITAYAKYVGLDAKETVARYMEDIGHKAADLGAAPQATPIGGGENPSDVIQNAWELPTKKIAIGLAGIAVVALVGVFIYVGKQSGEPGVAQITESRPHPIENVASAPAAVSAETTPSFPVVEDTRKVASPSDAKPSESPKPGDPASADNKIPAENKLAINASPLGENPGKALFVPPPVVSPSPSPVSPVVAKAEPVEAKAKVAEAKKPAPTSSPSPSPSPSPNPVAAAGGEEFTHDVSIEGKVRTWIKVVIDEKMPVEYFLPKGEKANYKAKNKIKVVLGDSTGAVVTYNGEVNKGKKFKGTIHSYIFPANARFPQDIPKRTTTTESEDSSGDSNVDPLLQ